MEKTNWEYIHSKKAGIVNELSRIAAKSEILEDSGVKFLLRVSTSLGQKPKAAAQPAKFVDPFENPLSQLLYAGPLTSTHSLIFNKFNLVEDHLIIVTNEFEPQTNPLSRADFEAMTECITQLSGLVFFNHGVLSGASQPHKHMQFVPLPLTDFASVPFETLIQASPNASLQTPHVNVSIPFFNICSLFDPTAFPDVDELYQIYTKAVEMIQPICTAPGAPSPISYNFLMTKQWMILVPRTQEIVPGTSISINSMGFAGTIFVKSQTDYDYIKQNGAMSILQQLTFISPKL